MQRPKLTYRFHDLVGLNRKIGRGFFLPWSVADGGSGWPNRRCDGESGARPAWEIGKGARENLVGMLAGGRVRWSRPDFRVDGDGGRAPGGQIAGGLGIKRLGWAAYGVEEGKVTSRSGSPMEETPRRGRKPAASGIRPTGGSGFKVLRRSSAGTVARA
jgi:hypothetical protein